MAHNTHSKDVLVLSSVHKCRCATKRTQKKHEKSEKKGKEKERKRDQEGTPRRRRCGQRHLLSPPPLSSVSRCPPSPVVHRPSSRRPRPHRRRAPGVHRHTPRRAGPAADKNARSPGVVWVRLVVIVRRPLPLSSSSVFAVRRRRRRPRHRPSSWSSWSSPFRQRRPIGQRWRRRHQLLRGRMDGAVLTWRALHGPLPRPSLVHPGSLVSGPASPSPSPSSSIRRHELRPRWARHACGQWGQCSGGQKTTRHSPLLLNRAHRRWIFLDP